MKKEINIIAPEGYEIDKENSTFECIKFKPVQKKRWRDDEKAKLTGYYINGASETYPITGLFLNIPSNYYVFATKKQAKSALAMARISQIMANDERFGGVVTDEEWNSGYIPKYTIERYQNKIKADTAFLKYHFLAFHTYQQGNLFLKENEDLVSDFLMI